MLKEVFSAGRFSLWLCDFADIETINLLSATTYGHPGKTRYLHQQVSERIAQIPDLHFLQLKSSEKLLGVVGFCPNFSNLFGTKKPTVYIRYFSVQNLFGRKSLRNSTKNNMSENVYSKALQTFFNNDKTFLNQLGVPNETLYYYAFVEAENSRSLEMCKRFGFEQTGIYDSILFSRFFPKKLQQVNRIMKDEKTKLHAALCNYYKSYNFFRLEDDWSEDYFVWKEFGQIVMGAKARSVKWKIVSLPGTNGKLLKMILPRIPLLNRIFNPQLHQFVALDYLYCQPGFESQLPDFFESILAQTNHYSALLFVDRLSELHTTLTHSSKMGFMNKINKPVGVNILVKGLPLAKFELSELKTNPTYISTFGTT